MRGRACEWIHVTRSIMSALFLLPGESWWSPLDLSFSPPTSRPATPSRVSGCMNVKAALPAAALALIALRIHTALTAPCPRKCSWMVAVNVLISFVCFPYTLISPRQRPLYLLLMSFLFRLPLPYFPPVCRGSIVSDWERGDHVYTGGPAGSPNRWWLWCGLDLRIISESDVGGKKTKRCCSANLKRKKNTRI